MAQVLELQCLQSLEDLVAIYHRTPKVQGNYSANFTDVTLGSLAECQAEFDVGLWALKSFGALLYPAYTEKLPFVAEHVFRSGL